MLPVDIDQDGDLDILAGNLGENARFRPTKEEPVRMYVHDFDGNGKAEQLLTYYLDGKEILFANHAELTKQMVSLKKRYLYAKDFAKASLQELFGKEKLAESIVYEANYFKSAWLENDGNGTYTTHALPDVLQFSTIEAMLVLPQTESTYPILLTGGNFYDCNIEMGRYDANYGNTLRFDGTTLRASNLGKVISKGQVRRIRSIRLGKNKGVVLAKNNDALQVLKYTETAQLP